MPWTATVIDLLPAAFGVDAVVVLSDGTQKFQQSYQTDGTLASLTPQLRATAARKDAATAKHDLQLGTVDLTPPVVVPPSPPDPVFVQFTSDLDALRQEVRAQALGLTTGNNLAALRATVQGTLGKNPTFGRAI